MKRILFLFALIATLVIAKQTQAQILSANYIKEFVPDSKSYFKGKNFAPYAVGGVSLTYSKAIRKGKQPFIVNVSGVFRYKKPPPPKYIIIKDTAWANFMRENNIEADSANFSSIRANSIDLLTGVGYILPHKQNSRFIITLNADFGVSLNNNTNINFYRQGKKTGTTEQKKAQLIINPNVQAKYFFTTSIGLNLIAGYNSRGGVNAGIGVVWRF
jgi:hypothetical protein